MDMFFIERLVTVYIETTLVVITGLLITGKGEWNYKLFTRLSAICWVLNTSVRLIYESLGIPLGTHTLIIIAFMIMVLKFVGKFNLFRSMTSILISFILLFLGEGLVLLNFLRLNNISFENLFNTLGGRLFGQLLTDSLMIILIVIILGGKTIYGLKSIVKGIGAKQ